jgi:hypothetical protein
MGPSGRDGQNGNGVLSGEGAPTMEDGQYGDFWYDVIEAAFYGPKNPTTGWGSPIYLRNGTGISLQGVSGSVATSTFSTTGAVAAQNVLPRLRDLSDVSQHSAPAEGTMPIWSTVAQQFIFNTPNAHVKPWDTVHRWESGATVIHHGELWRATTDNSNIEPQHENGRVTLYINVAGEPTFGLVPMGLGTTAPPSGNQPLPASKYAYHLVYTDDATPATVWKFVVKGANPDTHQPYGQWEGRPWQCIIWRSLVPPPLKFPPNVVMVWIYGTSTGQHPPVLGQQAWASVDLNSHISRATDVEAPNPTHGDLLIFDASISKWRAVHRNQILSPSQNETHPLRMVNTNPVIVSDTDYSLLLDLPSGTEPLITLPNPVGCKGRELHVKNYHTAVARSTVANVRSNRDYATLTDQITANANGAWAVLVSDGIAWVKLQAYPTSD